MTVRCCNKCGTIITSGSRCAQHPKPIYGAAHRKASAGVMANAKVCWICNKPPTPTDPLTADHILPLDRGGTHTPANYAAAHFTCNSRRGNRT